MSKYILAADKGHYYDMDRKAIHSSDYKVVEYANGNEFKVGDYVEVTRVTRKGMSKSGAIHKGIIMSVQNNAVIWVVTGVNESEGIDLNYVESMSKKSLEYVLREYIWKASEASE